MLGGGGLQVDKAPLTNISNVYVPQQGQGNYPYYPPPVYGNWNNAIGMGKKKSLAEKDCC